jgi:hypothetical protein
MAELEARKMRYPTTGTEGLLMGILVEGEARDVSVYGTEELKQVEMVFELQMEGG